MKSYICFIFMCILLWACDDNENVFEIKISQENISFRPVPGGAIMYYKLPSDLDVMAIRVRYKDAFGQEMVREGSYVCDSLLLYGFNEARQGVEGSVTVCNRSGLESESVMVNFDTEDSGPIAFFRELEVKPGWNGFGISYNVPKGGEGMAHVFYLGENPLTKEPDTLLVKSFVFKEGQDSINFQVRQEAPEHTVVVRTEDLRGYIVKEQVWNNIKSYNTVKLEPELFEFLNPENLTIESVENGISKDYLFDGDLKGFSAINGSANYFGTYVAGPDCFGKTLFELDLKEAKRLAEVRIYAILSLNRPFMGLFANAYENRLPCDITIYGSNDRSEWSKIGHYEEACDLDCGLRWSARSKGNAGEDVFYSTELELKKASPCYLPINFSVSENSYRYIKIVVGDTANARDGVDYNIDEHVTFHEFELYVGKE